MLRLTSQFFERFSTAQGVPVTDKQYIKLNVFRFITICTFALLCLLVNVICLVVSSQGALVFRGVERVPLYTAIGASSALVLNNTLGAAVIQTFVVKRFVYTLCHVLNALGAAATVASVIETLYFAATLSKYIHTDHIGHYPWRLFVTLDVFNLLSQAAMVTAIAFISYESTFLVGARTSKFVILFLTVASTVMGAVLITHNWNPYAGTDIDLTNRSFLPLFQQLDGVLIICQAKVALLLCLAVKQQYAINSLVTRLIRIYFFFVAVFELYSMAIFGFTLYLQEQQHNSVTILNVLLIGISIAAMALCALFVGRLQKIPKSNLKVEKLDLFTLSAEQRRQFALRMTANRRIGEPTGDHAMGLLTGYSSWTGDNISCSVVRVYRDDPKKTKGDGSTGSGDSSVLHSFGLKKPSSKTPETGTYDTVKAWQALDEEKWIFTDRIDMAGGDAELKKPVAPVQPVISKAKQKRLDKKKKAGGEQALAQEQTPAQTPTSTPGDSIPPAAAAAAAASVSGLPAGEFQTMLENTEALVLLTCIEKFDLTSEIPGRFGKMMSKLFGKGSSTEWLCVRLGLVATHWPFRPAIFRCSKTKRPVARNAAILRSLTEWNNDLSSADRFGFILAPHYKDDSNSRSINPGGWKEISLPPTHILDLRPYQNLDLKSFLKTIKYRDQAKTFEREGGRVIVSEQFRPEEVDRAYDLWKSVAHKRANDGHTSNLAEPDTKLLQCFANPVVNECKTWSLMFLMLKDTCVASCVLVRLGDTITSDIQGLDYEEGHKMKAYFVMMQSTIEVALEENISFVEFGPSTAKPKTDIGCSSINMTGALYVRNPLLSLMVKIAAKNVDL